MQVSRGRDRGREEIPNRLCGVSTEPDAGLELKNMRLSPELKSRLRRFTDRATQAPQ